MIIDSTIARWTWGRDLDGADKFEICLLDHLRAYAALTSEDLASNTANIRVRVHEYGNPRSLLFDSSMHVSDAQDPRGTTDRIVGYVRETILPGRIGFIDAYNYCTGRISGANHTTTQEDIFLLSTDATDIYSTTALITYSDSWMPFNLKGEAQPEIYAANHFRLAAALGKISEVLDSEIDPDDPNYFAVPTETGVANHFESDGTPSVAWPRYTS